ncbi:hypothetical protein OZX73_05410 [Bifidobacterium sp. ESL0775]|uniref:hypothetical protein n=1 Tax=Bifidobacterium sp. ESL0775 TaxID=2983230 RepID=UPI0023F962C3|nr:hypothetical protein [Bifidobacterium sp. ESL0775]WEV68730.1 hypothetical protein OZX73_05410 [Bifidobacterium sp. ESL0775]
MSDKAKILREVNVSYEKLNAFMQKRFPIVRIERDPQILEPENKPILQMVIDRMVQSASDSIDRTFHGLPTKIKSEKIEQSDNRVRLTLQIGLDEEKCSNLTAEQMLDIFS